MIMIIILAVILLICALLFVKNEVTLNHHISISCAIHEYHRDLINEDNYDLYDNNPVEYKDMESYFKTFRRFWDWGYKRILPREKYEIIKPYLEKGKR